MKIQFSCGNCGKKYAAKESLAGRRVACSGCGAELVVPALPAPAAEPVSEPLPIPDDEEPEPLDLAVMRSKDDGLDMTPMVDVTFQLFIFFMVTAAFSLQMSIETPPPEPDDAAEQQQAVQIDMEDSIIIQIAKDDTIWVNDREATSEQDLLVKLRDALEGDSGSARPATLIVMADRECRHETVVRALDAGNSEGLQDIRLAYVDEEQL